MCGASGIAVKRWNDSCWVTPHETLAVESPDTVALGVRVEVEHDHDDADDDAGGGGGPGERKHGGAFDEMKRLQVVYKGHEGNCAPAKHETKPFTKCYNSCI